MFEGLKGLRYKARVALGGGGEPRTIDVAGRLIRLLHGGRGEPLVYLHSALGESLWLPFHAGLARRFEVFAPTHPGFGGGGPLDGIDGIEDLIFHYLDLFDALGLDRVHLGGVSLGGWIAAEFAVRYPERVSTLFLADAPGLWIAEEPPADLFRIYHDPRKLRALLFHQPDSALAALVISDHPTPEQMLHGFQAVQTLARLLWDRPYNPKLAGRLRRITGPALVLWGADDRLIPPSYGRAYAAAIPGAQFHAIPACGHLPMFEAEAEFVQAVTEFIDTAAARLGSAAGRES